MKPQDGTGQASWLLVDALGLPADTVQPGLAVDDAQWARLVDTARAQRFGGLPLDEGFHEVGRALGEALMHSDVGRALNQGARLAKELVGQDQCRRLHGFGQMRRPLRCEQTVADR